jgi:CHAT domain-containing protein
MLKPRAQAVAALYPQAVLLTGTQASEVALRNHLPEVDVIHLATHGALDPLHPLFSALLLSGTGDKAQEDSRLEVWEIFGLDLRQANLVVLSACETALGKQNRGDEVAGMARAFLYAGTPVVIASLWPVEDEATQALMVAL